MKTKFLSCCVFLGFLFMWLPPCHADRASHTLSEKVKQADAIVVGTVTEVEAKRIYALTVFKIDSDQAFRTRSFKIARLHLTKILKEDPKRLVNEANPKKRMEWMNIAFLVPGGGWEGLDYYCPSVRKGDTRIWFLEHDRVLTGSYFVLRFEEENFTEDKVKEIEKLIEDQRSDSVEIVR